MSRRFLAPPLELLTADGAFHELEVPGAASWRRPIVLLARELCSFELFEPAGASGAAAAAAARLYARTGAPFTEPGGLVRRSGDAFGIWWWDMARIGPQLQARFGAGWPQLAPETLAQPPGQGWRIVRASSGYEAQCWRGGTLIGSSWRHDRFDDTAWSAFARVQRGASEPAPATPPPVQQLPLSGDVDLGLSSFSDLSPADLGRIAAVVAASGLLAAAALFTGQGWRLNLLAGSAEHQAATLRASTPRTAARDQGAVQRLAAFRKLSARPNPASALTTALDVLQLYAVKPTGFEADASSLTLTLPYSAIGDVDKIALELEDSGAFTDVRPLTDDRSQTIELQMRLKGAGPSPPG